MKASDRIAEMRLDPFFQNEAFHRFCRHPLAQQLLRQIEAGQFVEGGELVQSTYAKAYRDMAIEEETGVAAIPDYLKSQA